MKKNSIIYSVNELARELGVGRMAIYAGLRAGTIPSIRLGNRFILPRAAIARWLESAGERTGITRPSNEGA